ncbi:MAG: NAD(P)H-dependent oxidoreductase subunit E [Candidatus Omnitrophota bacterium]
MSGEMRSTESILKKYEPVSENMLLILHDLQNNHPQNYLKREALDAVARYLNTTRSTVYGVVSYYSMFSLKPRGRHVIRLCISPVCRLMGGVDMMDILKQILGIREGESTPDGRFTLEPCECLGQCDRAPVLMLDNDIYGNLTEDKLRTLIDGVEGHHERNERNEPNRQNG